MAPRGRKPKSAALKLIEGNPGKRAITKDIMEAVSAVPEPPDLLTDSAKVEWERMGRILVNLNMLSAVDTVILSAYCQSFARWADAEEAIAKMALKDEITHGLMIITKNGNAIQNPLVGISNRAKSDAVKYASEMGMTPAARARFTRPGGGGDDIPAGNPWAVHARKA